MAYIVGILFLLALSVSWIPLLAVLTAGVLTLLLWGKKPLERKTRRKLVFLILFVCISILPLLWERSVDASIPICSLWGWEINSHTLHISMVVLFRSLICLSSLLLLVSYYPIYQIFAWMRRHRVPLLLLELMELTYRYIYVLEERASQIVVAQQARLGYGNWRNKIRHTNMLLARSFVLTHTEAEHIYNGLLTRAYEPTETMHTDTMLNNSNPSLGEKVIELQDLGFAYEDGIEVLHKVNLKIYSGEKLLVLGLNGSGKSTLFSVLSGIYPHSSGIYYLGNVEMKGRNSDLRTIRQTVGIIFQNSNHQLFCPSVRDELAFGLRNIGLSELEIRKRVEELVEEFALASLLDKAPHQLSEGQKKWVAIASVIALKPKVLILDEPTASLDQVYMDRVMELLDEIHKSGTTIVFSTHDRYIIEHWQGRVIQVEQGRVRVEYQN